MEENIERPVRGAAFHAEGEWAVPEGYEAEIKDGKIIVRKKESEDERIRTQLLDFLEHLHSQGTTMNFGAWSKADCANWIAYLEKQKFHTEGDFGRGYDCGYQACLNSHGAEWFEKQKEQATAEKQDYSGLNDLERAIFRGFLAAGVENVPVGIIKDTAAECIGFLALIDDKPAERSDETEHQCDCEHVGCHINNCRRWCRRYMAEIPYTNCDPTCSGYSHKNTGGISAKKPTWTGNDSMALVSMEAIINNSNHDEARKKELFDWLLTRVQNGFSHTLEEKEFVRTIKSLVADFIYQKEGVDTSYYQRLVDWVEKRHIESIVPLWTPTEAQMWALQEAVSRSCSSEYGGPLSEMLEMLNRSLGRKTAWEKCKPGATDDNAVAFVYLSPEAWKFAPAGTTFSEDVLLVCEGMAPRITRCAANNGYFLPISRTHPPKNVTDKLGAQYGESHGEPAPDNQNKDKNT